jgi:hypothetical protein
MLVVVVNIGVFSCHRSRGGGLPLLHIGPHIPFVGRMVFVQIDGFPGRNTDIAIASVVGWQAAAAGGWGGLNYNQRRQ